MYLYFHTNTEMALHYIKDLLRDDAEHPVSEIYDYVMENCKGQAIMGQPMTATVISSALWRLAHTEGSGYYRTRRGIYQKGDPEKEMKAKLTPYERAVRIVTARNGKLQEVSICTWTGILIPNRPSGCRRLVEGCWKSWRGLRGNCPSHNRNS